MVGKNLTDSEIDEVFKSWYRFAANRIGDVKNEDIRQRLHHELKGQTESVMLSLLSKQRKIAGGYQRLTEIQTNSFNSFETFSPHQAVSPESRHIFSDNYGKTSEENLNSIIESDYLLSSECEGEDICDESFSTKLRNWSLFHNITHIAINGLLKILESQHIPNLPGNARTLLKTPRGLEVSNLSGGQYCHMGITNGVRSRFADGLREVSIANHTFLQALYSKNRNLLTLTVNVDSLPLSKRNNLQFWSILATLDQSCNQKPFLVGLFCGYSKPKSVVEFLTPFVDEMSSIECNGLYIDDINYRLFVRCFITDAPARSFLKGCKKHSSYHSCEKCVQKGRWSGRVIYETVSSELRTDLSFKSKKQPEHHNTDSPLERLHLGLVSQFPLDYMHLVCLGIVRELILYWVKGPIPNRLSSHMIERISQKLMIYRCFSPKEFDRKPRSIREVEHWKASELRTFLLYTGPCALKDTLDSRKYKHFMLLRTAIFILLSETADNQWVNYASELLGVFVKHSSDIYGKDCIVHNVHSLLHIADDVKIFGPLDSFSAFAFENHVQIIKRIIRANNNHLQQAVKCLHEYELSNNLSSSWSITSSTECFHFPDNCMVTSKLEVILLIRKRHCGRGSGIGYTYRKFGKCNSYSLYPCDSKLLHMCVVSDLSPIETFSNNLECISKCFVLPSDTEGEYIVIGMAGAR